MKQHNFFLTHIYTSKQIMLDLNIFNFNWGKMKNMLDFLGSLTMLNWSLCLRQLLYCGALFR